jgi:hypothetical protein
VKDVTLFRVESGNEGTFGILVYPGGYLYTGELPWRQNKPNISRIPGGRYTVRMRISPKYGRVYEVTGVENRSYILLHQGNYCGDRALHYRTNVQGCILLGLKRGRLNGQSAVLSSRIARTRFETRMNMEPFQLEVINGMA